MEVRKIKGILTKLQSHQNRANRALNFTPSENIMSPLSRIPFIMDIYSRYFFEHKKLFGEWLFFGGIEAGEIQGEYTEPLLRRLSKAEFVDVRAISGLNCMTIVMAGLCKKGGKMFTVPEAWGGHMSTCEVASRLGIETFEIPFQNHEIDLQKLEEKLRVEKPDLIYIDQSTQLFPLDPHPVRELVDSVSPETLIHYDSSHTNGLILGGSLFYPLERGAHSFGGSTHKTLPGPHKAFFATNESTIFDLYDSIAYHFISHSQISASISLAITLLELEECGGSDYSEKILQNAKRFAHGLAKNNIKVAGEDKGFTQCHQVWASPEIGLESDLVATQMYELGLLVNKIPNLPTLSSPSFRLSMAEITKLGAQAEDIDLLIQVFTPLLKGQIQSTDEKKYLAASLIKLINKLSRPQYCYTLENLNDMNAPDDIIELMRIVDKTNFKFS